MSPRIVSGQKSGYAEVSCAAIRAATAVAGLVPVMVQNGPFGKSACADRAKAQPVSALSLSLPQSQHCPLQLQHLVCGAIRHARAGTFGSPARAALDRRQRDKQSFRAGYPRASCKIQHIRGSKLVRDSQSRRDGSHQDTPSSRSAVYFRHLHKRADAPSPHCPDQTPTHQVRPTMNSVFHQYYLLDLSQHSKHADARVRVLPQARHPERCMPQQSFHRLVVAQVAQQSSHPREHTERSTAP